MADSTTSNYAWFLPEVGASPDTWGNKLNADLVAIDALCKKFETTAGYAAAGGTVDAITLTLDPAWTALQEGMQARFQAAGANTAGVTVNVSGLGAKAVKTQDGGTLPAGFLATGYHYEIVYDLGADCFFIDAPSVAELRGILDVDNTAGATGQIVHPGGIIEKWGYHAGGASTAAITFGSAFPTACDNIQLTGLGTGNAATGLGSSGVTGKVPMVNVKSGSITTAGFEAYITRDEYDVGWADNTIGFYWRAIGR